MFTVALVGPDGAGKTTVARRLAAQYPGSFRYLYMGVNPESADQLLPTSRLLRAVRRRSRAASGAGASPDRARVSGAGRRSTVRALLALVNRLAEEWYRQVLAWRAVHYGRVVLFDRHFFADYYATDVAAGLKPSLARRIHGLLLAHLYPKPDLVIYLDAPPGVLFARKGEGTLESLAQRRREYEALSGVTEHFATVDAAGELDHLAGAVLREICSFAQDHRQRRLEACPDA
jgi:thymidylate kinase